MVSCRRPAEDPFERDKKNSFYTPWIFQRASRGPPVFYPIFMILLQTAGTVWCQMPHTRKKWSFFKVRGLEIRNLNLFPDPLTVSDPNFQKC